MFKLPESKLIALHFNSSDSKVVGSILVLGFRVCMGYGDCGVNYMAQY